MKMLCDITERRRLIICLNIIKNLHHALILAGFIGLDLRQFVDADAECVYRCLDDIIIHTDAPEFLAVAGDTHIGDRLGR